MGIKLKNNVTGFLATAINASTTGITLQSGNGANFPSLSASDYFYATLVSSGGTYEIVKVTARIADAMTIVRGQEGTTANGFAIGSRIEMRVTAQTIIDAITQLAQSEYQVFAGTGSQTVYTLSSTPADVTAALVVVNGLVMSYTTDYTISGTTLTFVVAPTLNDEIIVRWSASI